MRINRNIILTIFFLTSSISSKSQETSLYELLDWTQKEKQKNLIVWYDMQDKSKIQLNNSNTEKVKILYDKSVWKHDITQIETNSQPLLISDKNWINGPKFGLSFEHGGYMQLKLSEQREVSEITSFVVCRNDLGGSKLLYDIGREGGEGIASCYSGSNMIESRVPNSLVGFRPDFSNNPNKYLIIATRGKRGNIESYLNETKYSGGGTRNFEGNSYNQIRLSTKLDVAPSDGVLFELIVFDKRLTDIEFSRIKDYLNNKYVLDNKISSNKTKTYPTVRANETPALVQNNESNQQPVNSLNDQIGKLISNYDEIQSNTGSDYNKIKWIKIKNKYGFINSNNILVTPIIYDRVGDDIFSGFYNGLCSVQIGDKWGLIDTNGNVVIQPKYKDPISFTEGLCLAIDIEEQRQVVIDKKGNVLIDFSDKKYYDISSWGGVFKDGVMEIKYKGAWTYIDRNGNILSNRFSNSTLNSITLEGKLVSDIIYKRFETIFNNAAGKIIYYSSLNKKYNYQADIKAGTDALVNEVEGWLRGPLTNNQVTEFNSLKIMAEKQVSRNLEQFSKILKANPQLMTEPVYGNSNSSSNGLSSKESNSNSTVAKKCIKCSQEFTIRDYDDYTKLYSNFRKETKYGFVPCHNCQGTKKMSSISGSDFIGKGCFLCKNSGWLKCTFSSNH